jgi:hypothetical protein
MTKRRSTDWDESRLQSLAVNYRQMREQIWGPLADRLGEKWEHVEKAVREEPSWYDLAPTLTAFSVCNKAWRGYRTEQQTTVAIIPTLATLPKWATSTQVTMRIGILMIVPMITKNTTTTRTVAFPCKWTAAVV